MKKIISVILISVVALICLYFGLKCGISPNNDTPKTEALSISKNNDSVNLILNELLTNYYSLSKSLANWDTSKANASATAFANTTTKIPFGQLKGDSSIILTAQSFAQMLFAESQGLLGEINIEGKRHSFYTLSDNLFNLLRTVRYDQAVIYYINSPSAFGNNEEAYWLSNSKNIENPYLGNKKKEGTIEDSIDFRSK